jgi:nucleotide-binding universal stress UspA family protein
MAKYQRILAATDLSEHANKALAEAVSIARRHDAELHVVHVDLIAQPGIAGFERPDLPDYIHSLGQTSMDAAERDVGVSYRKTVTANVRDTTEAGGILRYAQEHAIDLIVIGTHGRGAVAELIMGSVAQRVVRESPVPVVVVRARRAVEAPSGGKPVFLVPVDLSADSEAALVYAGAVAAQRDAHLIVLHAIAVTGVDLVAPPGRSEDVTREQLDTLVTAANLPLEAEAVVGLGPAAFVIADLAAKRGASLIVIAPSRHNALDRLLLGSVTKNVIRMAPCPVLVHRVAKPQQAAGLAA